MKRLLQLTALFFLAALPASAQFTLVTGTVTDPNGIPYAGGTIAAQIVNQTGLSLTLNGGSFSGFTSPVGLDGTGSFTMQLADNAVIQCGNATCAPQTQWQFTVDMSPGQAPPFGLGPKTFAVTITITGALQVITSQLTAAAPALTRTSSGTATTNVQYLSRNCGGQQNCTPAKWDAGTSTLGDATTTSGSNIVTCPECKFVTGTVGTQFPPATIGQIFFANDSTSAVAGVNTCVNNPTIQFGGANETTIFSVDSDTQVHVVGNAGTSSAAKACIAWGDDDTPAINAAWAAGGCTVALTMPIGSAIFSAPVFQKNTGCSYNGAGPYLGQRLAGSNLGGTYLIPVPMPFFNFAPITGGQGTATSCTTCTAAVGNYLIFDYRDFGIFGLGQQATTTLANTDLFLAGTAARVVNVNGVGWLGQGGGNTLIGFHFLGDQDLFAQGGANFIGSIPAAVDAHVVTFSASFITGMTSATAGVAKCGLLVGNFQTGSNLLTINNSTNVCAQLGNSGGTTTGDIVSLNSQINSNPNGTPDNACLFVGQNSTATLDKDLICNAAKTNETAVNFFSTGGIVRGLYNSFTANGTANVITNAAGNTFQDIGGNTFTGGAGVTNGLGNWLGDGSSTAPAPTISSGFGTSPAILKTSGATSFTVNVGTGGTATSGVIGLSAARNGWTCTVYNQTAHAGNRADDTVQTANTASTVTFQNQTKSTGAAIAWTASDTLNASCRAN